MTNDINVGAQPGLELNVLYCNMPSKTLTFQFGKVIGSQFLSVNTNNYGLPSGHVPTDTTYIIGNTITRSNALDNAGHYLFITGNFFNFYSSKPALLITRELSGGAGGNYICNNEFFTTYGHIIPNGPFIGILQSADFSNFRIYGNKFYAQNWYTSNAPYRCVMGSVSPTGDPVTTSQSGYPEIKYNVSYSGGVEHNLFYSGGPINHSSNQTVTQNYTNNGAPTIDFYDTDMTRNDIGRYGGPYAWSNYNSGTGPRIYHLEMPFQLLPGETPNIKAEAIHD